MNCDVESDAAEAGAARRVAAEELEREARHGVEHDVAQRDLALELLARREPQQEHEDQERRQRLVELRRVQRRVHGRADGAGGVESGKVTAQGTSAGLP